MRLPAMSGRARGLLTVGSVACSIIGGVVIWKDSIAGEKFDKDRDKEDLITVKKVRESAKDKVYVVTGANSGIGREIATDLAHRGAKVYMACRDLTTCEAVRENIVLESRNKYVYCRKCDLASLESVSSFVSEFRSRETRLDGLVNNAGVMNSPRKFSAEGVEIHLAVNHLGHFLLTSLLKDVLISSAPSRVVYLVNLDYRKGAINFADLNFSEKYDQSEAFYQSQLANMIAVKTFAKELSGKGVTVNAAYPGVCSTNIKRHMGVDKSIVGTFISKPILWFLTRSPVRGAQTPLYLCLENSMQSTTGKLFSNMKEVETESICDDEAISKRLLAVDQYWSGLVKSKEDLLKSDVGRALKPDK